MSTADLLEKWREASRAAELAKRLAESALEAAERAERNAMASEEIAQMAERTADAAAQAAQTARRAADAAAGYLTDTSGPRLRSAETMVDATEGNETAARDAYQEAAEEARKRNAEV